jgi:hypothetical protein
VPIPSGATTFTGITVKYQILNKFDLKNESVRAKWKNEVAQLAPSAAVLTDDVNNILNELNKMDTYASEKRVDTVSGFRDAAMKDAQQAAVLQKFEEYWQSSFPNNFVMTTQLATDILSYFQHSIVYQQAWNKAVADTAGNLLTIQYAYNKQPNQPDTHDSTIIYSRSFASHGVLNFNGAVSVYNGALPPGAKYGRVHYGQVSGEYDRNLGSEIAKFQSQMSLAGYWQYQPEPSIINLSAGTLVPGTSIPLPNGIQEFVGTAGSLWVTQAKYTLKNSSGVSVPIGVSWSNKTDLLQGSKVGAQVGVSYSLNALAGLFTGKP